MPLSIQLRLSLSFLFTLILGIALAIGLTWFAVESLYLNTQRENLVAQAELTAATMDGFSLPTESSDIYMQTSNILPGIHTRLLDEQGGVVVSLSEIESLNTQQVPAAENAGFISTEELLQRPEIQKALSGEAETAVRKVTAGEGGRVLYAAAPVWDTYQGVSGIVYLATPLPDTGLPTAFIIQVLGTVILSTALAGFMGTLLARGISKPIQTLDQTASAVAKGDLDHVVKTKGSISELDRLNASFNEMVASIKRTEQVKNAFITDVTHELRTPLTVIKGTIETLEGGALDDLEERLQLLTAMSKETERLIRLVNGLLILTRFDSNALQMKMVEVDLAALARSRCEHIRSLAENKGVELIVTPDPLGNSHWVSGDPDRLAQVLDNLLDNAIRHSPADTRIKVRTYEAGGKVYCRVADQGEGIPPEHLHNIFDRFYRVDSSRNRKTGGAGLGLAIAATLIKAHGGEIQANSIVGEGSEFLIRLPKLTLPHN